MKKIFTLLTMLLAAVVISCTKSDFSDANEPTTTDESIPINVSFVVNDAQTRSMHYPTDGVVDKSAIEDSFGSVSVVAVMGTDDNSLVHPYALTYVAETKNYTVMLPGNVVSNSNCTLYFIANKHLIIGFDDLKTLRELRSATLPENDGAGVNNYVMITNGITVSVENGLVNIKNVVLNPTVARLKLVYVNNSTPIEQVTISGTLKSGNLSEFFGSPINSVSGPDEFTFKDEELYFDYSNNPLGIGYYYVYPSRDKLANISIKLKGVAEPRGLTLGQIKRGSSYTINVSYKNQNMSTYEGYLFDYDPQTNTYTIPYRGGDDVIKFEKDVTLKVDNNATLKVDSNVEGLTLTIESNADNTLLKIHAEENNTTMDRTVVVTVTKAGGAEEKLTIIQSSPNSLMFVRIPDGKFYMGSPDIEAGRDADETQHQVTLSQSYQMSKYEITNYQYCEFLNAKNVASDGKLGGLVLISGNPNLQYISGRWTVLNDKDKHPVTFVSWAGASAFAEWAGGRLPTEAEWEYACRGDYASKSSQKNTRPFNFGSGSTLNSTVCNFAWLYSYYASGEFVGSDANSTGTTEVGRYTNAANNYGLYDMHGNVWEWCSDFYDEKYGSSDASNPATDPKGAISGTDRVLKGGSWYFFARACRSAYRMRITPQTTSSNIGFRIVR